MDLENTDIEIRERSLSQRLDIALHIVSRYPLDLLKYGAMGIVPFFVLNIVVIQGLDSVGFWEFRYWASKWFLVWALTLFEAPLATAPLLLFLSQKIFRQQIRTAFIFKEIGRRALTLFLVHGLFRLNIVWLAMIVLAYQTESLEFFIFWLVVMCVCGPVFWWLRPYVDCIIFLEQLPIWAGFNKPTIGKRSRVLHGFSQSEVFSESVLVSLLTCFFAFGLYGIFLWIYFGIFQETITLNWFSWTFFAWALWIPLILTTLVRFLGYLDTRIRLEGWELELRMRSEGAKHSAKLKQVSLENTLLLAPESPALIGKNTEPAVRLESPL